MESYGEIGRVPVNLFLIVFIIKICFKIILLNTKINSIVMVIILII